MVRGKELCKPESRPWPHHGACVLERRGSNVRPGQPRQLSGDKKTSARWRQRSEIAQQLRVKWDKLTQNTGSKNHHRELFLGSGKAKWLMPTLSICSQRRPWWPKAQLFRTRAKPQWGTLLVSYGTLTCSLKIWYFINNAGASFDSYTFQLNKIIYTLTMPGKRFTTIFKQPEATVCSYTTPCLYKFDGLFTFHVFTWLVLESRLKTEGTQKHYWMRLKYLAVIIVMRRLLNRNVLPCRKQHISTHR